jgi:pyruvate-ferredoxin/flavodoxin oxidoreductase
MALGAEQQKKAVDSGVWPLYRFDPRRLRQGKPPLELDSPRPKISPRDYMRGETRFRMVERRDPERFKRLLRMAEEQAAERFAIYEQLAGLAVPVPEGAEEPEPEPAH